MEGNTLNLQNKLRSIYHSFINRQTQQCIFSLGRIWDKAPFISRFSPKYFFAFFEYSNLICNAIELPQMLDIDGPTTSARSGRTQAIEGWARSNARPKLLRNLETTSGLKQVVRDIFLFLTRQSKKLLFWRIWQRLECVNFLICLIVYLIFYD